MSIRVMDWAWGRPTQSSGQRLVLLALADHAGEDGRCYPSTGRIAAKCHMSESMVRQHLDGLVVAGLVAKVQRRRHADGSLSTWVYELAIDTIPSASGLAVGDTIPSASGLASLALVDQRPSASGPARGTVSNRQGTVIAASARVDHSAAAAEPVKLYVEHRISVADPRTPDAYRRRLEHVLPGEHGEAIAAFQAEHPDADAEQICLGVFGMSRLEVLHARQAQARRD